MHFEDVQGMQMKRSRATLKDVAQRSGYALRTVKKVMGGTENVGEKTRAAVLQAAKELDYQRNILASALSKGKSSRVAIVYTETMKAYFPEVERGFIQCAEELRDFGFSIEFHKVFDRDPECQVAVLKEMIADISIDGLVIQPMSQTRLSPYIDELVDMGKPVITFGADASSEKRLCYIGPNAYQSGRVGAQILANYIGKSGNVAMISDNNEHMQTVDRLRGFAARMKAHYPNVRIANLNISVNPSQYYDTVKELVTRRPVQGVFCTDANSYIAGEVLRDLNIRDTVVVGFDMSPMAADLMKQGFLKVIIEQNPYQFSYAALRTLFNYIYFCEVPQKIQYTGLSILTSECLEPEADMDGARRPLHGAHPDNAEPY